MEEDEIDESLEGFEIAEDIETIENSKESQKRIKSTIQNERLLIQKKSGFQDNVLKSYPKNERGVVVAKPFDYEKMRKREAKRGVVFLQQTTKRLSNRKEVKDFFSREEKVFRVEPHYKTYGNKEKLEGFYVEFASKEVARKIIQQFHNKRLSRKISTNVILKLVEDFRWSDFYDTSDKKKMIRKFILLNTEKELKEIQEYKKNVKQSKKLVKNQQKMKRFRHKQKKVKPFTNQTTDHLSKMDFF